MSTHSDGEDSQMHDNASLPSSTPSTPPASGHNPGGIPTSPPGSQQAGAASSASFDRMTGVQSQGQAVGPSWAGKRAQEEADYAKEKCVDKMFTLRWLGDPMDESDMRKV